MERTIKQMITDLEQQVRRLHDTVAVLAMSYESFNERWTGIEDEIRKDVKRSADKMDALAAVVETAAQARPPPPKKRGVDLFLE